MQVNRMQVEECVSVVPKSQATLMRTVTNMALLEFINNGKMVQPIQEIIKDTVKETVEQLEVANNKRESEVEWLTIDEIVERYSFLCKSSVYDMVRRGMPSVKKKKILINPKDLEAFLDEEKRKPKTLKQKYGKLNFTKPEENPYKRGGKNCARY